MLGCTKSVLYKGLVCTVPMFLWRPVQVRLEQVIADAFSVLETESATVGVPVSLPDTSTQVTVDQAEIQEVIVNMLQNSLYWLRQVPQDCCAVAPQLSRVDCTSPGETAVAISTARTPGSAPTAG